MGSLFLKMYKVYLTDIISKLTQIVCLFVQQLIGQNYHTDSFYNLKNLSLKYLINFILFPYVNKIKHSPVWAQGWDKLNVVLIIDYAVRELEGTTWVEWYF